MPRSVRKFCDFYTLKSHANATAGHPPNLIHARSISSDIVHCMIPTHTLSVRVPRRTYYRPSSSSASLFNTPRERAASSQRSRDCNTHQVAGSVLVSSMPRAATPLSRSEQRSPTRTWAEFLSVLAQGSHRYHYNVPACVNTTHLLPRSSMEDLDSDFERSSRELAHPESGTDSLAQGARSTVVAMVPLLYISTMAHRAYLRRDTLLDSTVR